MAKIEIKQFDPVGILINSVEMEVEPSINKDGFMTKSRFFVYSNTGKIIGRFKVYANDSGEIDQILLWQGND